MNYGLHRSIFSCSQIPQKLAFSASYQIISIPVSKTTSPSFFTSHATPSICCEIATGQGGGCFKYEGLRLSVFRSKAGRSDQHGVQFQGPNFPMSGPVQQCAGYPRSVNTTVASHLLWIFSRYLSVPVSISLCITSSFLLIFHLDFQHIISYLVLNSKSAVWCGVLL